MINGSSAEGIKCFTTGDFEGFEVFGMRCRIISWHTIPRPNGRPPSVRLLSGGGKAEVDGALIILHYSLSCQSWLIRDVELNMVHISYTRGWVIRSCLTSIPLLCSTGLGSCCASVFSSIPQRTCQNDCIWIRPVRKRLKCLKFLSRFYHLSKPKITFYIAPLCRTFPPKIAHFTA